MTDKQSWTDRLVGGFRKTSEKLTSNLTEVVGTAKLDDATLDDVEEALILSDLGPSAAARIGVPTGAEMSMPLFFDPLWPGPKRDRIVPVAGQAKLPANAPGWAIGLFAGSGLGRVEAATAGAFSRIAGWPPGRTSSMSMRKAAARCSNEVAPAGNASGSNSRCPRRRT